VTFTGDQDLTIEGNGATLEAAGVNGTAFVLDDVKGDLTVLNLTVQNAGGEGITYKVDGGATGTIRIVLFNVTVRNNRGHGVWIADQLDNSAPDGQQPPAAGSDASLDVTVMGSRFVNNGTIGTIGEPGASESDRDGLRVDEGGPGDLTIAIRLSVAEGNGADGIEVDERDFGDVRVDMLLSRVDGNGAFDPADRDDGFDIDEWNDGSIFANIVSSSASDNWEEGFDFNENGLGDLRVRLRLAAANRNREEGIDLEEDDETGVAFEPLGGDLVTTMTGVSANGNGADGGDGGVKIREKADGRLEATLSFVEASDNLDENAGIHIREDADGDLQASLTRTTTNGNAKDGVVLDERGSGDLDGSVADSTSSNNADDGIQGDQAAPGVGAVALTNVTLQNNGDDPTAGNVFP
jgi:hypothetical protein